MFNLIEITALLIISYSFYVISSNLKNQRFRGIIKIDLFKVGMVMIAFFLMIFNNIMSNLSIFMDPVPYTKFEIALAICAFTTAMVITWIFNEMCSQYIKNEKKTPLKVNTNQNNANSVLTANSSINDKSDIAENLVQLKNSILDYMDNLDTW